LTVWEWAQLVLGLGLVLLAAEALVRGASELAAALGIPPLVIGLTVVAFGTSSPELAVSVAAAFRGNGDITFGNVAGSNLFNIAVVLGAAALIRPVEVPMAIRRQVRWIEAPLMLGAALAAGAVAWDGRISRWEGLVLVLALILYILWQVREARAGQQTLPAPVLEPPRKPSEAVQAAGRRRGALLRDGLLVLGGLGGLYLGSEWMVDGAVALARWAGVPDRVIALTLIAGGTSLPEVATSVVSAIRRQPEIALGNVLGSNLFNVAAVLGLSALVSPADLPVSPDSRIVDLPVLAGLSTLAFLILAMRPRVSRLHGALLLVLYGGYVAFLVARP
jgi:cation:H+ antiporter